MVVVVVVVVMAKNMEEACKGTSSYSVGGSITINFTSEEVARGLVGVHGGPAPSSGRYN